MAEKAIQQPPSFSSLAAPVTAKLGACAAQFRANRDMLASIKSRLCRPVTRIERSLMGEAVPRGTATHYAEIINSRSLQWQRRSPISLGSIRATAQQGGAPL